MNKLRYILMAALAGITLGSCNEFVMLDRGNGYLSVDLQRDDSIQTRAVVDAAEDQAFSLKIYKGEELIKTVDDHRVLAETPLTLVADTYKITATSGTLQDAAWDEPFYTGETTVKVLPDKVNNAELTCYIANVAVSVEFDDTFTRNVTDYSVSVDNGEATLTFSPTDGTVAKTAYFKATGKLNWTLTFTNADGKTFTSTDSYENVEARQHYQLKFSVKKDDVTEEGYAGFKIIVDDSINPSKEVNANLFFNKGDYPTITVNDEFKYKFPAGDETPKVLTCLASNGISRLIIRQKAEEIGILNYSMWYDLVEAQPLEIQQMGREGIVAESVAYGATEATIDITKYVSALVMGAYTLEAVVYDIKGNMTEYKIELTVESGVDAEAYRVVPGAVTSLIEAKWFSANPPEGLGLEYRLVGATEWIQVPETDLVFDAEHKIYSAVISGLTTLSTYEFRPYSINHKNLASMQFSTNNTVEATSVVPWGRFAVVYGKWFDEDSQPNNIRFEYRPVGTSAWTTADKSTIEYNITAKTFVGEIRGLNPSSTYEFRANSDAANEEQLNVMEFTTETAGTVYNLTFDDWYQDGKVWYPFAQGSQHAWDSANGGAASLVGSMTTPVEGTDAVSGKAVRMESKYAVIAFAAGNLYTGDFGKIDGVGAQLEWGIPFDSRPLAMKGHYKYSPKAIDRIGDGMDAYKGQMDKMQIQIFITDWTAPFLINTKAQQFVDFNAEYVIAYGKIESDVAYDTYQEFTIPLEYRSLTKRPSYIVISACASYLGDYFTGGEGSVLFVDEFSLEYNPENLTDAQREIVNYR